MTLEEDNDKSNGDPNEVSKQGTVDSKNLQETTTATTVVDDETAASVAQKRSFDEIDRNPNPNPAVVIVDDQKVVPENSDPCDIEIIASSAAAAEDSDMSEQLGASSISKVPADDLVGDLPPEPVTFNVVYAKESYQISMDLNQTVEELKNQVETLTGVACKQQKLCFKGSLSDSKTLKESGFKQGIKVLMIGSKMDDILAVSSATKESVVKEAKESQPSKEPLCQQKPHKKTIDKGVPEWAMPAWIGEPCDLPPEPLTGMVDKYGNKVRLTFKLELDEVWIGTKQRTQKLSISSIQSVLCEPIDSHPEYHMMGFQVGPTEASRLWFYWVPSQYVRAIKRVVNDY